MKGKSSLPSAPGPILLLYVDLAVNKVVSSHIWLETTRGRGDEWMEACQHCQPKSVSTFLTEVQESKHNGRPRQSGRTEAQLLPTVSLVYAVLGASPAHLCQVLVYNSPDKGQWDWSLLSLAVLNNWGRECPFWTSSWLILLYASHLTFTAFFVKTPSLIPKLLN